MPFVMSFAILGASVATLIGTFIAEVTDSTPLGALAGLGGAAALAFLGRWWLREQRRWDAEIIERLTEQLENERKRSHDLANRIVVADERADRERERAEWLQRELDQSRRT